MARRSTQELQDRLHDLLEGYTGKISLAEAVGVMAMTMIDLVVMDHLVEVDADESGGDGEEWKGDTGE